MGGIRDTEHSIEMQCLPLYSILQAMGNPTVNYFSLDIEGAELQVNNFLIFYFHLIVPVKVLRTLPWDKVDIEVLSVETHLGKHIMIEFPVIPSAGFSW